MQSTQTSSFPSRSIEFLPRRSLLTEWSSRRTVAIPSFTVPPTSRSNNLMFQANVSTPVATFPPIPHVPEPAIFDPSYAAKLVAIFNDSSFPPQTPPEKIYYTRLKVVEAILASRRDSAKSLSVNLLVAWVSMVLLCAFLLVRIRRNRVRALLGDVDAAQKIILPAFEPLLWIVGIANFVFLMIYTGFRLSGDIGDYYNRFTIELAWGVKLINCLLVITYMLQPSLSMQALVRAICQALFLSAYTVPVVLLLNALATPENQLACHWTLMGSRGIVVLYLLYLMIFPPARASVLSFRLLCLYVVIMAFLIYGMAEEYHHGKPKQAETLGWIIAGYTALLPLFVWNVLRADTEHWRGIGKRAVELQDTFRRKTTRVQERVSSQGLHVLIEMHRKYIIDFSRLQFGEPIGEVGNGNGTKATVYRGFLHSRKIPVAIKVYMPTDFTEETVAEFSHEAALCGALTHPNILKFHGLCVCPPNICLVTELCQGSLQDVMDGQVARLRRGGTIVLRREQTLIDVVHLIDAARALAHLHSFSPPFVHRDIKPSSFLLDDEGTVKLTDFGASRILSVRSVGGFAQNQTTYLHSGNIHPRSVGPTVLELPHGHTKHTVPYMAPEVTKANQVDASFYGEAADVFSLGMMMWDILHPDKDILDSNTPTLGHTRTSDLTEAVFAGHRPPLNPLLPAGLRELIESAWHADPRKRPTAQALVTSLESIQEELCAPFALELMSQLHMAPLPTAALPLPSFAGTEAVEKLRQAEFVNSPSEAIRLGNSLMDCGFLHHTKHSRCFGNGEAHFMFDSEQIMLCQPLALLESCDEAREGDDVVGSTTTNTKGRAVVSRGIARGQDPTTGSHISQVLMERRCACRKLGQRIETERSSRRRFLDKFKPSSDEHLLTTSLLTDDMQMLRGGGDFTSLQEPRGRNHQAASEAA